MAEGKSEEAERSLQSALFEDPLQEEARAQLAYLLLHQGRLDEAEKLLREGLSRQPQSAFLHLGLGRVQHNLGQLDQAVRSFARALELAPESSAPYRVGIDYLDSIARERGIEFVERAIEKGPGQQALLDFIKRHDAR
jgi:tetratricopeptide (TPR) repeat protein